MTTLIRDRSWQIEETTALLGQRRTAMRIAGVVMGLAVLFGLAVLAGLFLAIAGHVILGDVLTGISAVGNGVIYAALRSNRRRRS